LLHKPEPLFESTYTLALVNFVMGAAELSSGAFEDEHRWLRIARMIYGVLLALCTSAIQLTLVICTKKFVCALQLEEIRESYAKFEKHMYGHVSVSPFDASVGSQYDPALFEEMDRQTKRDICQIPLSQPVFLAVSLLVWTVTCMGKIRQTLETFIVLVWNTPTVPSMIEAIHIPLKSSTKSVLQALPSEVTEEEPARVVVGLTSAVKVVVSILIFVWASTAIDILWLGCRWLEATGKFDDLVGNAVALEFILYVENLLYWAWSSFRQKQDLQSFKFVPAWERERVGWFVVFAAAIWAFLACSWVYLYMYHLQSVLPTYKWDVQAVCQDLLDRVQKKEFHIKPVAKFR
jgi:hypothetical protein